MRSYIDGDIIIKKVASEQFQSCVSIKLDGLFRQWCPDENRSSNGGLRNFIEHIYVISNPCKSYSQFFLDAKIAAASKEFLDSVSGQNNIRFFGGLLEYVSATAKDHPAILSCIGQGVPQEFLIPKMSKALKECCRFYLLEKNEWKDVYEEIEKKHAKPIQAASKAEEIMAAAMAEVDKVMEDAGASAPSASVLFPSASMALGSRAAARMG